MDILIKHVLRNIVEKKFRTAIIILAIVLSSALLYINFQLKIVISEVYTDYFKIASGTTDLFINDEEKYFFKLKDVNLNEVNKNEEVPLLQYLAKYSENSGKQRKVVLTGMDKNLAEQTKLITLSEESKSKKFDTGSVIISKSFAENEGYKIGDKINITINDKAQNLEIFALADSKGIFYSETTTLQVMIPMGQLEDILFNSGIITEKDAVSGIYVDVADQNIADAKDNVKIVDKASTIKVTETINQDKINEKISSISMILNIALVLMIVLSGTVIFSLYKHIHSDRLPNIATFRSIGANKSGTSLILILETCMYGLIGGILGVFAGIASLPYVYTMVVGGEITTSITKINPVNAAISIILTVFIAVLTTSFSLIKLSSRSVKDAIFNTAAAPYKLSKVQGAIGLLLFCIGVGLMITRGKASIVDILIPVLLIGGFVFMIPIISTVFSKLIEKILPERFPVLALALKNIKKNKIIVQNIRIVSIVTTLAICVFAISNTINTYLNDAQNIKADLVVNIDSLTPNKDADEIIKLKGIKDASVIYASTVTLKNGDNKASVNIYGRTNKDKFDVIFNNSIKISENAINELKGDEIILDKKLLEKLNVKVGDKVNFEVDGKNQEFKIKDEMDSYKFASDSSTVFISLDSFKENVAKSPRMIYLTTTLNIEEEKNIINDYIMDTDSTVITFDEFIANQRSQIDSIMSIIKIVIIAGVVICLLGIINNLLVGYVARKKEFATLYSCAMNKKQLRRIILSEVVVQFIISLVFWCGLSSIVVYGLSGLVEFIGFSIQVEYPISFVMQSSLALFVVYVIGAIGMFRIVNKLQVMKELRYE